VRERRVDHPKKDTARDTVKNIGQGLSQIPKPSDVLSAAWLARVRTAVTLAVLVLLVFVAVRIGLERVAEPFPQSEEPPICTPTDLVAGDPVEPQDVTVSILNAGGADGLASRTLSDLGDQGFGRGQLGDAPEGTDRVVNSQIWTTEGPTAAVRLVRSYLTGKVTLVEREGPTIGITVVVGEEFTEVQDGKNRLRARDDETTCVPTAPAEAPTVAAGG